MPLSQAWAFNIIQTCYIQMIPHPTNSKKTNIQMNKTKRKKRRDPSKTLGTFGFKSKKL